MAIDEIEDLEQGANPQIPPYPQSENEATGRMNNVPKSVAVPSVVSKQKQQNIPAAIDTAADKEKALKSLDPDEAPKPQTGDMDSQAITKGLANALSPDAANTSSTGKISGLIDEPFESDDETEATAVESIASKPLSSAEFRGAVTGNLSGNSININEVSPKGLEIRKEQIQRAKKRASDQKRKRTIRIVRRIVIIVLTVLIVASVAVFSVHRWGLHDDRMDIQGKWQIGNSKATVTITEDKIKLNKEVSYSYTIDPSSKTLVFDFGQLGGNGRYRFSLDRNHLSLMDGTFETTDTLSEDIPWTLQAFWDYLATSNIASPDLGDGSITLNRVIEE